MKLVINHPKLADLATIMTIERAGFSAEEAATEGAMAERITLINDTFVVARNEKAEVIGYVVGPAFDQRYLTDDLYDELTPNDPQAPYQTVLSLAVAPDYHGQGLGSLLLSRLAEIAKAQHRQAITLTCLAELVPFYEKNGYQNEGISDSTHAGEIWYNMVYDI
ncbi:GNAT family N-acetyltransferase [Vagococcus sp. BWB3-3]|uniref:GNAT family N-acetyltransferase n=1 Tax=Vagococcus allomyrinae TaxID=2794353 RepID=A0A940SWU9_9ENTE|nr:GNAT family N-acetyltransferase [Vagococcus allomyrinae]MBP1043379.1 GNAT family N-acetyltransferase [Vagococcus allomyrinae]